MIDLYSNYQFIVLETTICKDTIEVCCQISGQCNTNYMAWHEPGLGRYITYLWMEGAVLFTIVMLIELRVFRSLQLKITALFTRGNLESQTADASVEVSDDLPSYKRTHRYLLTWCYGY